MNKKTAAQEKTLNGCFFMSRAQLAHLAFLIGGYICRKYCRSIHAVLRFFHHIVYIFSAEDF